MLKQFLFGEVAVSIHAPLAGRDRMHFEEYAEIILVSIHAPLAGRDVQSCRVQQGLLMFHSTRPSGGATRKLCSQRCRDLVSIHAPLAGRDVGRGSKSIPLPMFQSTRPSRGATVARTLSWSWRSSMFQSTRPSRGATEMSSGVYFSFRCFNPRAPRGARQESIYGTEGDAMFQSTRPSRGATACMAHQSFPQNKFQSTRPSRGATVSLRIR